MTLDQLRPARSRLPAKAGEDLRVQKCVRYQGQEPTLQDVAKVQKRRQQAQLHSKEGKLHAKGWSTHARGEGTTAGKQGNNKPKKAAPQATKGKNATTRATGKGKGAGQKGKGKPQAPTSGANGGGGSRAAPARDAQRKLPHIVSESDDHNDNIGYGSKGDLGWSKRTRCDVFVD